MISDLLRVTGGAGQQVPARTQLLRLPFRCSGFLRCRGRDGISWQGGPRQQTGSPYEDAEGQEA